MSTDPKALIGVPDESGGGRKRTARAKFSGGLATVGGLLLGTIILSSILGPLVLGLDPNAQSLLERLNPPGWVSDDSGVHWLGTDTLGRDILTRILVGARLSLLIGFVSVAVALLIGVMLGLLAGFLGGIVDDVIMRAADLQLAFPLVLLALAVIAILGGSVVNEVLVFSLTIWPVIARTTRGSTLVLREAGYVEAATSMGARTGRIVLTHILPNAAGPLAVIASFQLATVVIYSASLGFLGLGVQPPTPTWGNMMAEGRSYLATAWWITFFPGVFLVATAAAVNWIGDGISQLLDPRLRQL